MSEYEYMELDLSPLLTPNIKFAVRCETEEEAKQFIAAVIDQFPDKTTNLHPSRPRWDDDNYGNYGGRAYFPDLNNAEKCKFVGGDVKFANDYGYTLIYFRDLLVQTQIDESDMSLDMLFGY